MALSGTADLRSAAHKVMASNKPIRARDARERGVVHVGDGSECVCTNDMRRVFYIYKIDASCHGILCHLYTQTSYIAGKTIIISCCLFERDVVFWDDVALGVVNA